MDDNLIIEDGILRGYKENLIQTITVPEALTAKPNISILHFCAVLQYFFIYSHRISRT